MQPFTSRVIELIKRIPKGRVMTYGQIAACAGNHRAARQVVRILHSQTRKHRLPWHRVINAKGEIGIREPALRERQIELLEQEGVVLSTGMKIDLGLYLYQPTVITDIEIQEEKGCQNQ
jgi:methylated-DNA-protein-cysteine methyltransferase-like protein